MKLLFCYYKDVEMFKHLYFPSSLKGELDTTETISEYPGVGTFYLDYWSKPDVCGSVEALKIFNDSFDDVRQRCRGLRDLDNVAAKRNYIQVLNYWLGFFQTHDVSVVYTICVDTFIVYACHAAADALGVEVKSYVRFFVEGFWRKTRFGELNEEADNIANMEYLAEYFSRKEESHFLRSSVSLQNEVLIKKFKSLFKRLAYDFLGYRILQRKEWKYRFSDYKRTDYRWPTRTLDYSDNEMSSGQLDGISVLFLHYTPEATTDFWASRGWWNYEEMLLDKLFILKELGINVSLKEHRHMLFKRDRSFYESIALWSLGSWLPFNLSFWDVSKSADFVIVTTGSVGIEAIFNGNNLILIDMPYYLMYEEVDKWVKGIGFVYLTAEKRENILKRLSTTLIR